MTGPNATRIRQAVSPSTFSPRNVTKKKEILSLITFYLFSTAWSHLSVPSVWMRRGLPCSIASGKSGWCQPQAQPPFHLDPPPQSPIHNRGPQPPIRTRAVFARRSSGPRYSPSSGGRRCLLRISSVPGCWKSAWATRALGSLTEGCILDTQTLSKFPEWTATNFRRR